jgi:hypothetical protein
MAGQLPCQLGCTHPVYPPASFAAQCSHIIIHQLHPALNSWTPSPTGSPAAAHAVRAPEGDWRGRNHLGRTGRERPSRCTDVHLHSDQNRCLFITGAGTTRQHGMSTFITADVFTRVFPPLGVGDGPGRSGAVGYQLSGWRLGPGMSLAKKSARVCRVAHRPTGISAGSPSQASASRLACQTSALLGASRLGHSSRTPRAARPGRHRQNPVPESAGPGHKRGLRVQGGNRSSADENE